MYKIEFTIYPFSVYKIYTRQTPKTTYINREFTLRKVDISTLHILDRFLQTTFK